MASQNKLFGYCFGVTGGTDHRWAAPSQQVAAGFVTADQPADVAVVIVTYNSAADLPGLFASLRSEAAATRLRVIVADNASADESVDVARAQDHVIVVETGGNLGYAAGINRAAAHAGDVDAILVLNPDLTVQQGCIEALKSRVRASGAGIVVPRIIDSSGVTYTSLRREPTLLRAVGDALLGNRWLSRPEWLSESIRTQHAYDVPRRTDWATGAALLVSREAWDVVGPWDESFFLYSEETDFFARARDRGFEVWYEPAAVVQHRQGGSGTSAALIALLMVNRVRYLEKHRPTTAELHRAILILHEELRRGDPTHAEARWALRSRRRWSELPGPSSVGTAEEHCSAGLEPQRADERLVPTADREQRYQDNRPRSIVSDLAIDHVLITRFNLPSVGPESVIRAQDGWLQNRVELFEQFTVPSVLRQSFAGRFDWIVYFDPESPAWLLDRLAPLVSAGVFTPIYREVATWKEVIEDADTLTGAHGDILITTNLDNDDGLAVDFVQRLQSLARKGERLAVYLADGLILSGDHCYLRVDRENAFCSVAEPWDGAVTTWRDWHNMLKEHMPLVVDRGRPAWLQVVHGRNVSNVVRGRLVDPAIYATDFAGLLDGVSRPRRRDLVLDAAVRVPLRDGRDVVRRTGRSLVVRLFGKEGLDRVKSGMQRIRRSAAKG